MGIRKGLFVSFALGTSFLLSLSMLSLDPSPSSALQIGQLSSEEGTGEIDGSGTDEPGVGDTGSGETGNGSEAGGSGSGGSGSSTAESGTDVTPPPNNSGDQGSGNTGTTPAPSNGSPSPLTEPDPSAFDSLEAEAQDGPTILSVGPDGGQPPYVYWTVKDSDGNLVPGATFTFEYRDGNNWDSSNSAKSFLDCVDNNCESNRLDRDTDGGEFLVDYRSSNRNNNNRIQSGNNYRVTPMTPPPGYSWVNSTPLTTGTSWSSTVNLGAFAVTKIETVTSCVAGYVYGVSAVGQLQQIDPSGNVIPIGAPAAGVGSFNGLGIGSNGDLVYAYERTNGSQTVTMYTYDTATGNWTNTGDTYNTTLPGNGEYSGNLVAGSINLSTDKFMFGGYQDTSRWVGTFPSGYMQYSQVFKIWEYDPLASPKFVYKGHIQTHSSTTVEVPSAANGDIAFDAVGNLFAVRGSGSTTTVFSVTAANLAAANGGLITSSQSASFTTMNNVNGVAFDADGKAYLGASTEVRKYDMPDWSNGTVVTTTNYSGTDMSSCSSPPTIKIEKFIEGGRMAATDQFKLSLTQGTTLIGEATTTGNAPGMQAESIGPLPTVRNVALNFSETAAGTTNLSEYVSSYRCLLDGEQFAQGDATSGSVTIPSGGQAVECTFYNAPLAANVSITKMVTDTNGENPVVREGWTVGAAAAATTGSVTKTPTAATQPTNAQGVASWNLRFGGKPDRATVTVHEATESGYTFQSGECTVTHLDGTTTATTLTGPEAQSISGVQPGDRVDCVYVNRLQGTTLTLEKLADNPETGSGYADDEDWTLTATGSGSAAGTVVSGTTGVSQGVPAGSYALTEVFSGTGGQGSGYEWSDLVCVATGTGQQLPADAFTVTKSGDLVTGGNVILAPGDNVTCTYTNTPKPGSVSWQKVDEATPGNHLGGSEWEITGTDPVTDPILVVDCVGTNDPSAEACSIDRDTRPGYFDVGDLLWGAYELVETRAPAGFVIDDTPRPFTITATSLNHDFDAAFVNEARSGPAIPLTGGLGRDAFLIAGGAVLLLGLGAATYLAVRNRRKEAA